MSLPSVWPQGLDFFATLTWRAGRVSDRREAPVAYAPGAPGFVRQF